MNRFLSKKKPNGMNDASSISSQGPKEGSRWKRNRRGTETEKPMLDLTAVLPSSDDFRTSLIMPNLSARFSMLREQDDPNTKIGKASDDSVLQPRRQSRLYDFGFDAGKKNLTDIAEVASIQSSVRPPWLTQQHDSFVSDDDDSSHNGSVMSRARPVEGNNLFGGRQKVYKIAPSSSTKSLGSGAIGKLMYEDDVHKSAFQKYKEQEKEREAALAGAEYMDEEFPLGPSGLGIGTAATHDTYAAESLNDSSRSMASSSHIRQQSAESSATSAPSQPRTSTPATSFNSQPAPPTPASSRFLPQKPSGSNMAPPERSLSKRRLYEHGLGQHMYEQQASALTRLNSIQRQRTFAGGKSHSSGLPQSKSSASLQERSFQPYAVGPTSPPPNLTTFGSIRKLGSNPSSPPISHPQSPTYMSSNEYDEAGVLSSTMQPSDRGKATAMGAFNMPKQQFDETQYLQRLQQLQQNKDQPMQNPHPSQSPRKNSAEGSDHSSNLSRFDSARHTPDSQEYQRSRSRSSPPKPETGKAFSVFQNAAAQFRVAQGESPEIPQVPQVPPLPQPAGPVSDTHRTFFGDISASDDDDDDSVAGDYEKRGYGLGSGRYPSSLPSVSEHPAMRSQTPMFPEIQEEDEEDILPLTQPLGTATSRQSMQSDNVARLDPSSRAESGSTVSYNAPADRGTDALRGLVQQHLRNPSDQSSIAPSTMQKEALNMHWRNPSDQSSIYPATIGKEESLPNLVDRTSRSTQDMFNPENRINSNYTNSNPWDLDDFDSSYYYGETESAKNSPARTKPTAYPLEPSISKGNINSRPGVESEDGDWQPELKSSHTRDISTGTIQEREAFANELAARQKAIQENLRSIVEVESRGSSPQPSSSGAFKAFNMLKPKSSRESMARQDGPSKAMKMLGMGGKAEDEPRAERVVPNFSNSPRPMMSQRIPPTSRPRQGSDTSLGGRAPVTRVSPSIPPQAQPRSRSGSTASTTRVPSRQDRYQDATDRLASNRSAPPGVPRRVDQWPMPSQSFPPEQSPDLSQHPAAVGEWQARGASDNRLDNTDYVNTRVPPISQTTSGRNTPIGMTSAPASAAMKPGPGPWQRPAGANAPFSANGNPSNAPTPMNYGSGTPTGAALPPTRSGDQILRKRTVSKNQISEPVLISSTSNVDTIDLPPGASLRNGMEPPTVPSGGPRRTRTQKLFGRGRDVSEEQIPRSAYPSNRPPAPPNMGYNPMRSSPGRLPGQGFRSPSPANFRPQPRTMRSEESLDQPDFPLVGSDKPVMTEGGMF